jgi:hypothetical protein
MLREGHLGRSYERSAPWLVFLMDALAVIGENLDHAACGDIAVTASLGAIADFW